MPGYVNPFDHMEFGKSVLILAIPGQQIRRIPVDFGPKHLLDLPVEVHYDDLPDECKKSMKNIYRKCVEDPMMVVGKICFFHKSDPKDKDEEAGGSKQEDAKVEGGGDDKKKLYKGEGEEKLN